MTSAAKPMAPAGATLAATLVPPPAPPAAVEAPPVEAPPVDAAAESGYTAVPAEA
jgi:hypothetical protein